MKSICLVYKMIYIFYWTDGIVWIQTDWLNIWISLCQSVNTMSFCCNACADEINLFIWTYTFSHLCMIVTSSFTTSSTGFPVNVTLIIRFIVDIKQRWVCAIELIQDNRYHTGALICTSVHYWSRQSKITVCRNSGFFFAEPSAV